MLQDPLPPPHPTPLETWLKTGLCSSPSTRTANALSYNAPKSALSKTQRVNPNTNTCLRELFNNIQNLPDEIVLKIFTYIPFTPFRTEIIHLRQPMLSPRIISLLYDPSLLSNLDLRSNFQESAFSDYGAMKRFLTIYSTPTPSKGLDILATYLSHPLNPGVFITNLNLAGTNLSDKQLLFILKKVPGLRELDISSNPGITNKPFWKFMKYVPRLEKLVCKWYFGKPKFDGSVIRYSGNGIAGLRGLRYLDLAYCSASIDVRDVYAFLVNNNNNNHKLEFINIMSRNILDKSFWEEMDYFRDTRDTNPAEYKGMKIELDANCVYIECNNAKLITVKYQ